MPTNRVRKTRSGEWRPVGGPQSAGFAFDDTRKAVYFNDSTDSQYIDDLNFITVPVTATTVDSNIFTAPYALKVTSITYAPTVAGTNGSAVTLEVEKCTGTTAPASGTAIHSGTANLKGTINTVQTLTLVTSGAEVLAAGDRLALDVTGTLTDVAGVVTIGFKRV